MPAPRGNPDGPPRAMIIDSWFDNYVGVVMLVRVVDGVLKKGDRIRMMATNTVYPHRADRRVHAQVGAARGCALARWAS